MKSLHLLTFFCRHTGSQRIRSLAAVKALSYPVSSMYRSGSRMARFSDALLSKSGKAASGMTNSLGGKL